MAGTKITIVIDGENKISGVLGDVKQEIGEIATATANADSEGGGFFSTMTAAASGFLAADFGGKVIGAVTTGVSSLFSLSSETTASVGKLQAQLGITKEEAQGLGAVATDVFSNNFAGSLTEASEAVGVVQQQLGGLVSADQLQGITEDAFRLKDAFGVEVPESISATRTLMENFGLTSKEATDFLTTGFQRGLDRSGDFMDTINEYATQFKNGGADAGQFFSVLESGLQGGALGTDKAADAFKEFSLRIADGSSSSADALKSLGIDSKQLWSDMSAGKVTTADAFQQVIAGLNAIEDPVARNAAGVALLGTQYEDLGASGALGLSMTKTALEDMSGATAGLDAQYTSFGAFFTGIWREAQVEMVPVTNALLGMANEALPMVKSAWSGLKDGIQWVMDNGQIVVPVISGIGAAVLISVVPAFVAWAGAAWATAAANIAALAPLAPIILGVGAVVGVLYAAWTNNWGGIQEKTASVVGWFQATIWPWFQTGFAWLGDVALPALSGAFTTGWGIITAAATSAYAWFKDTIWPWLSTGFGWLGSVAIPALGLAFSTGFTLITGYVTTAYAFFRDTVWPWLSTNFGWLGTIAIPALGTAFSTGFGVIKTAVVGVYEWWRDTFYPWLSNTFTEFKAWMGDLEFKWGYAIVLLRGHVQALADRVAQVRDSVMGYINEIKGYWTNGWDVVKNTVSSTWETISGYITGPINTAKGAVDSAIGTIKGYIQSGIDKVNSLIDAINSIPVVPDLPKIPGYASGTVYSKPGMALVGENGPELVGLSAGQRVYNAAQTRIIQSNSRGAVTASAGTVFNITQNIYGGTDADGLSRVIESYQMLGSGL